ncbi:MAG: hypothetical protein KJ023_07575, partial [Burkholderiaceae bacterium]|nr:hypothetical protein [Burkholderiaceae bacterium]
AHACLAKAASTVWPSACLHGLGTPNHLHLAAQGMYFAAQYPACLFPCQRFAHTLTNVHA